LKRRGVQKRFVSVTDTDSIYIGSYPEHLHFREEPRLWPRGRLRLRIIRSELIIASDASKTGWGIVILRRNREQKELVVESEQRSSGVSDPSRVFVSPRRKHKLKQLRIARGFQRVQVVRPAVTRWNSHTCAADLEFEKELFTIAPLSPEETVSLKLFVLTTTPISWTTDAAQGENATMLHACTRGAVPRVRYGT
jgi:hypothetical protein